MNKQDELKDKLTTLNLISYQMAELARIKEELEEHVSALLEHSDEGSKTYVCGAFKVTVTSGYNYSLDKEEYEILAPRLSVKFDPIRKRVAYDIDKSVIRDIEKYGNADDLKLLGSFISKKPKKIHLKLTAAI